MKYKILLLILFFISFAVNDAICETLFDKIIEVFDRRKDDLNKNIFSLQKAPEISLENVFNQKLNELLLSGSNFKYGKEICNGDYLIQITDEKIILKILMKNSSYFYNSNNPNISSKALNEEDIKDVMKFIYRKIDNYWSLEIENLENFVNIKKYIKECNESNLQNESLISNFSWKEKIIIDKEIMNGYSSNVSGQIYNRTKTRLHLRYNNEPCDIYSDLTAETIIPYDGGNRAKIFSIDKLWNRIIWMDRDCIDETALNPQFTLTSPQSFYSLAYPTDIIHGTLDVVNNNINNCGNTGKDSIYSLYLTELVNNRISKVDYRIRTYVANCTNYQVNKEYNIVDNSFTVLKGNCNFPYSLALHKGLNLNNKSDDVIWYSEGGVNDKKINCINAITGDDIPNNNFSSIDFGRGLETVKPNRLTIYQSPDNLKNLLCFIDGGRNSLIFLKLNQQGKLDYTSQNIFLDEVRFGNEQKLESVILTSNNTGLDGITVWAVTNAPGGCGPNCGSIHTLKVNYIVNTPLNVEYLASHWKASNSANSFVNLKNLHAQSGFLDIFTMEKWTDDYGMRRFKPGVDTISTSATDYCRDRDNMLLTIRTTNPGKILFDDAEYGFGTGWTTAPGMYINGHQFGVGDFNISSGTSLFSILIPGLPNIGGGDVPTTFVKIKFSICPQDESNNTSTHKISKTFIVNMKNCNIIGGGCPFVFVNNGNEFTKDNNILHRSEFEENIGKDIQDKYLLGITPNFNQSDSTYLLKIKELNNDISHFDKFQMVAVDHPADTKLGITESNDYVLYFPSVTESPKYAEHNGENVTNELNYDSNFVKIVQGETDDDVSCSFESAEFNSLKQNMKRKLENEMKGFSKILNSNTRSKDKGNYKTNKNGNDNGLIDSIAVMIDPSDPDNIPIPIGPPIKRPAGEIDPAGAEDGVNSKSYIFAKRQNNSPVIISIGKNINIDSVTSKWYSDFKITYFALTPVYYGGFIENSLTLVEANDSLNGSVLGSLTSIDSNYAVMDSTTNIILRFKNTFGSVPTGFVRDFVLITNGRYENLSGNDNIISKINENQNLNLPKDFKLHQNYPNPFNPVTTIKFDLPKEGIVKFKIYDILGKEVYSLNEILQAGYHNITFNGSNLSSGIYFYKIEYSNLVQTKRMVLIK